MVSQSEINKKVILAKAGSGKTTYITKDDAFNFKRIIYITYTNNNVTNIKEHLSKNPNISTDNVLVCTYHTFLIKFFSTIYS